MSRVSLFLSFFLSSSIAFAGGLDGLPGVLVGEIARFLVDPKDLASLAQSKKFLHSQVNQDRVQNDLNVLIGKVSKMSSLSKNDLLRLLENFKSLEKEFLKKITSSNISTLSRIFKEKALKKDLNVGEAYICAFHSVSFLNLFAGSHVAWDAAVSATKESTDKADTFTYMDLYLLTNENAEKYGDWGVAYEATDRGCESIPDNSPVIYSKWMDSAQVAWSHEDDVLNTATEVVLKSIQPALEKLGKIQSTKVDYDVLGMDWGQTSYLLARLSTLNWLWKNGNPYFEKAFFSAYDLEGAGGRRPRVDNEKEAQEDAEIFSFAKGLLAEATEDADISGNPFIEELKSFLKQVEETLVSSKEKARVFSLKLGD